MANSFRLPERQTETPAKPTFLSFVILRYAKNLIAKQEVEILRFPTKNSE